MNYKMRCTPKGIFLVVVIASLGALLPPLAMYLNVITSAATA
jgi:hypothetical protein